MIYQTFKHHVHQLIPTPSIPVMNLFLSHPMMRTRLVMHPHRQTVERTNMIGQRINFNFKLASISCVKTSLISLIFSYLLPSMNSEHRSSRIAPLFSFRFTPFRTLLPSRLQTRAVRSTTHPSIHWSISNRLLSIHSATTGYLSISHASSSSSFRLYPASNTHKRANDR